jgi:hypothetical protein
LFTGGDLYADAKTLNAQVQGFDRLIESLPNSDKRASDDLLQSWYSFTAQFNPYFRDTWQDNGTLANFLEALNNSNRDQLIQWETRFADLVAQFKAVGISSTSVDVAVSLGAPSFLTKVIGSIDGFAQRYLPWGLGFGTLLLLILIAWFFVKPKVTV